MSKIIPKEVKGFYRKLKNHLNYILLFIYLGSSWITFERGWGSTNQALLIDLPERKAYFFGLVILPNQMYLLMGILIISALALFLATSIFGRLWCGFSCPHTVFTDLFRKVESICRGQNYNKLRLKFFSTQTEKFVKLLIMRALWIFISFSFAYGWVCYFYGARELTSDLLHFSVSINGVGWLLGLTASTYFFAGHFREKVCTHICPYGRFQSAMVDNHTLQVHYNDWRGEPKGSIKSGASGDCIDCYQCVVVCPMGIDIRDGWQMACIGCGLCIDACDNVMEKVKRPKGLIAFESSETVEARKNNIIPKLKFLTAKNLIFTSAIAITFFMLSYSIISAETINYSVIYSGGQQVTTLVDGKLRSNLKLSLSNQTGIERDVQIRTNIQGSEMKLGNNMEYVNTIILTLNPFEEYQQNLFIRYEEIDIKDANLTIRLIDLDSKKEYKIEMLPFENN